MIIASKNIPKYFHALDFPVRILAEKGSEVAMIVGRTDLMALVESEVIIGIGSWKSLRALRLNRPLEKIQALRMKLLNGPPMATPLHYRDRLGDTHSVVVVKRFVQGGFHRWDNSFSIAELRKHPMAIVSAETTRQRHERA